MSAFRISFTTVATSRASGPYAALVAMTWLVSWTATPAHRPNDGWGRSDRPTDGRIQEHGERPEQGDRRDRVGDLSCLGPDDRRRGDDRRVAADRGADRDEDGQPPLDPDEARDAEHDPERGRHRQHDQDRRGHADAGDLAQAEARAEQDDPEPQDPLGSEAQPRGQRPEARPRDRRDDDPEQDGDGDLGHDRWQEPGDEARRDGDGDRRGEAGQDRDDVAQRRRRDRSVRRGRGLWRGVGRQDGARPAVRDGIAGRPEAGLPGTASYGSKVNVPSASRRTRWNSSR